MSTALHVSSFVAWTGGVGLTTWWILKRHMKSDTDAATDSFAGGQALPWYVVAGSLMLTNLSTEQLVGLNGSVFTDGCLAGMFWETFAGFAMIVLAWLLLPRYMRFGLITTSGFLGERYDLQTRTMVSGLFLVFYAFGLCPVVLYTGSLAVRNIFDLHDIPLWVVSLVIGSLGACYALVGGLKAVAVSDCLNGLGLIVAGLWVPLAALQKLGGEDMLEGLQILFEESKDLLPIVQESAVWNTAHHERRTGTASVPWHVILTGMMLVHMYYWSTNQVIVQRVLAARSLAHGQKGVLFAASMKVVGFTFLCMPGILGAVMQKKGTLVEGGQPFSITAGDEVYPAVVRAVMPDWSLGTFAGVLLGSVLSTFNSALNSAATIFGLEIYKIYVKPQASEVEVVRVATWFGAGLTAASFVIAPLLENVDGIYTVLQKMKSWMALPIVLLFYVGILTFRPDAFSAKVGFAVGGATYLAGQFVETVHYLHMVFICFLLGWASMAVVTYIPCLRRLLSVAQPEPHKIGEPTTDIDLTPWRYMNHVAVAIVLLTMYLTLSLQIGSLGMFVSFWILWVAGFVCLMWLPTTPADPAKAVKSASQKHLSEAQTPAAGRDGHGGGAEEEQTPKPTLLGNEQAEAATRGQKEAEAAV